MADKHIRQAVPFVIGQEKRLAEIIADDDIIPLIKSLVSGGASGAAVTDENDRVLWSSGGGADAAQSVRILPIHMEGEIVGRVAVSGERGDEARIGGLAEIFQAALGIILTSKLKRILTTEIHSTVVSQSHEELLEINVQLAASEERYRNLAESLEIKVEERTEELKRAHARLLQQEKLASIGQLAAGVAHEINNPMGFIYSNLQTMEKYVTRLMEMLDFYRGAITETSGNDALLESSRRKWAEMRLDFVRDDVFELTRQSLRGAQRVKKIVSDLKAFSHVDEVGECQTDLNDEIDKTLNVLSHEMPAGTEIVRNYAPLPMFVCKPALLCQVFLNIILNAIQSCSNGLRLIIATARHGDNIRISFADNGPGIPDGDNIRISFADNGPGIPDAIKNRIFEPFFTTRDVGSGAGLGLTVVYDIISGYGGAIEVNCPEGGGADFVITLPVKRSN